MAFVVETRTTECACSSEIRSLSDSVSIASVKLRLLLIFSSGI